MGYIVKVLLNMIVSISELELEGRTAVDRISILSIPIGNTLGIQPKQSIHTISPGQCIISADLQVQNDVDIDS